MPKKTAYSRSGAQRNKTKQKSFELVRPVSDENVLETIESSEGEEREEDVVEIPSSESEEGDEREVEEEEEVKPKAGRRSGVKVGAPTSAAAVASAPANDVPRSAAARMAARRQAAQRTQRSSSNLITVEHYNYVRKDLIFILILAIIMFGAIIVLHFVLGS